MAIPAGSGAGRLEATVRIDARILARVRIAAASRGQSIGAWLGERVAPLAEADIARIRPGSPATGKKGAVTR